MGALQFWLGYNNWAEKLQLPVNPESIKINSSHGWTDVNVTQLGEVSIPTGHKLTEISFSSFFPRDYDPSYCEYEDIPDPYDAVFNKIGRWKESGHPIRLTVTGTPINYACTIRSFNFEERFGSPGDVYFDLSLKEYVFTHVKQVQTNPGTGNAKITPAPKRPNTRVIPNTYTVKSGDFLTKIVQQLKVQGKKITVDELYQANKAVIGKNRNILKPGQVLRIP